VGLVLELLCHSTAECWRARAALEVGSPLLSWRLIERRGSAAASGLADSLRLEPGLLRFLCGFGLPDPRVVDFATLEPSGVPSAVRSVERSQPWASLARLVEGHVCAATDRRSALVVHVTSEGKGDVVENVRRVCRELGRPLLRVDAPALDRRETELELCVTLLLRDSYLWQAPLLLEGLDQLAADHATTLVCQTLRAAERLGWLVLLDGGPTIPAARRGGAVLWRALDVPAFDHAARAGHWKQALAPVAGSEAELWSNQLAARFRFEPKQIQETVDILALEGFGTSAPASLDDCFRACRAQAAPRLGEIGRIFTPRYGWADLVVPARKRAQLEAICQSVRHHEAVFGGWGFDRLIHYGRAVTALLVGPPGAGKTLAAEVIASELALDICKVDISGVVSKYIGETEQRLGLVFREAWAANAVLFFDEADALFGKRTEISDARDRYANIETSYLLQRIEEYEGIVILATNLRDNLDEAFTRRMRFVVEFPFPDEAARLDLWQRHLPPTAAPLHTDVDLRALAKRFAVSGGSIRNIALRAALLAVQCGSAVRMEHLIAAGREEFEKIGKSWVGE
jgi:hypothetical protein